MTKKILLALVVLVLLAIPSAAQDFCGVYELDTTPQVANGTFTVTATAYSDCYHPNTSVDVTATAPNGTHGSGSGIGAAYATAQASVSVANQAGDASFSGWAQTEDTCWADSGGGYSFGPVQVRLDDPTPVITGIDNTTWPAGATTPIHITGNWFGLGPTLSISDSSITYSISSSSNTDIYASVSVPASTPAENVDLSVVSHGFDGTGFQSTGGNQAGSQSAGIQINPIAPPTLTPAALYMSTGDTSTFQIQGSSWVQLHPAYTVTLNGNPYSTSLVTASIADASGTGSVTNNVTASPAGASGIFNVYAAVASTTTNTVKLVVPPQILIQELWGEANIVLQHVDINTTDNLMEALGNAIGNRMGDPDFPINSSWQAVIQGGGFYGYNSTSQQITTGVAPELYAAANVFSQGFPIIVVPQSTCFFSPASSEWTAIQNAQAQGATTVPSINNDPQCYSLTLRQFVIKRSTGTYPSGASNAGAPFFIFVRRKAALDPAVVTID